MQEWTKNSDANMKVDILSKVKRLARLTSKNFSLRFLDGDIGIELKNKIKKINNIFISKRLYPKKTFYVFIAGKNIDNTYSICGCFVKKNLPCFERIKTFSTVSELREFLDNTISNYEDYYRQWLFAEMNSLED